MDVARSRRSRLIAVLFFVVALAGACGSDDDTEPVRPVRLPPTTIAEGEPPPRIQEPPRPVEPLPPPEVEQP
ncbi:MAG: hypothetical protein OXG55_13760 [bacterium]|nr:hypothetical protein [bacterium]MCY4104306.1 hypothetical protein [bacterium]